MKIGNRIKGLLLLCALLTASLAHTAPALSATRGVDSRVGRVIAGSGISSGTGALVFDLTTSKVLYSHRQNVPMVPASNQKILTAAALLTELGPGHRFETRIVGVGTQVGTIWEGDIVLVGGGDPMLSTAAFSRTALWNRGTPIEGLVDQLSARQIKRISGNLIVDESYFDTQRYAPSWPTWFRYFYTTSLSSLTVNQGYFGSSLSGPATRNQALNSGTTLRGIMRKGGIKTSGKIMIGRAPKASTPLATIQSERLHEVLRFMMKSSDNFTAEILLKSFGKSEGNVGSTARGAREVRAQLKELGININGLRITDGSGLSSSNRVSATQLGTLLNVMDKHEVSQSFKGELAVSGGRGTLLKRLRAAPYKGRVFAKTGTLRSVSALSGYTKGVDGKDFGFVTLMNTSSISTARHTQDSVAAVLVK